jgi:hypothetical protein
MSPITTGKYHYLMVAYATPLQKRASNNKQTYGRRRWLEYDCADAWKYQLMRQHQMR